MPSDRPEAVASDPSSRQTVLRIRRALRSLRGTLAVRSDDPFADVLSVLAVLLAGAWVYYRKLGSYGLQTWDEGNYAVVAQFVLDGHVLVMRHYSFMQPVAAVPYFEKPPLALWVEALSMAVFGETPFAARLPSATFAIGIGVLGYVWGRDWVGRRTGLLAGIVFLTTPHVYAGNDMGRTGGVDTAFVFFGTLFCYLGWRLAVDRLGAGTGRDGDTASVRRFLPFYLAGVAAVLVKGLAAATFLLALLPLLVGYYRTFGSRASVGAAVVASAVGGVWPLFAYLAGGGRFVQELVVEQVLGRATGETGISYAGTTFEFMRYPYFRRLPTFLDPWVYFLLPAAVAAVALGARRWWTGRGSTPTGRPGRADVETTLLFAWWTALVPVLFAVTRGNHPWYLLPMYVPAALLVGRLLADASRGRGPAVVGTLFGAAGFAVYSYRVPDWSSVAVRRAGGLQGELAAGPLVAAALLLGVGALLLGGGAERLGPPSRLRRRGTTGTGDDTGAGPPGGPHGAAASDAGDARWAPGAKVVAVVALLLFVSATTTAPTFSGRGWDVQQREMAAAVDDAAPPDATVYMTPEATHDGVYHAFAFHADRSLESRSTAELTRADGVRYAVVAAGQVGEISRPRERLDVARTPGGTEVVLVRIGDRRG
jgi:4-amino-4-deoxy-L-arabinose transferase-like glycosyltransferase/predicted small secreted protein